MKPVQAQTKTDAAYRGIRVAIESGELAPGDRLRTNELQAMLGVSPTPIREALRLLQRDGLVAHEPHHGTVVASMDENRITENRRIRILLEPLATQLATERATDEEIQSIRALHDKFRNTVARDPAGRAVPRLNTEWHMAIYRASKSDLLIEFIERLWVAMGTTKFFSVHGEQSIVEHEAVMLALEARRPEEAGEAMLHHLTSVKKDLEDRAPRPPAARARSARATV